MSSAASTASNFLDAKIAALEDEAAYIECVKDGLTGAALAGHLMTLLCNVHLPLSSLE